MVVVTALAACLRPRRSRLAACPRAVVVVNGWRPGRGDESMRRSTAQPADARAAPTRVRPPPETTRAVGLRCAGPKARAAGCSRVCGPEGSGGRLLEGVRARRLRRPARG